MAKDYCPGFLDSSFGGIVASDEINDIDLAAKREAEEEMGLSDLKKIKLNGKAIVPQFRFKLKFNDGRTKCFLYIYDMPWSKDLEKKGHKIQPQKSEIDGVVWLSEAATFTFVVKPQFPGYREVCRPRKGHDVFLRY